MCWFSYLDWLYLNKILCACRRELQEELGITLPKDAFEKLYILLEEWLVLEIANLVFSWTLCIFSMIVVIIPPVSINVDRLLETKNTTFFIYMSKNNKLPGRMNCLLINLM